MTGGTRFPWLRQMASKLAISGPVKAPTGSYPKLWRLLDHYFLKEDVPDRTALMALDTIVSLNDSILENPKSANHRAIRSSDPQIRNLVNTGGTDILTEVGWRFKVMRMEECWVFPYDADLELLKTHQEKIVETQQKLKVRLSKSLAATSGKMEKEKADKIAIMKQIEQDKAERDHRNALKAGAPPKPTQSLDEIRKQAVRERMERDKARKARAAAESASQEGPRTPLPGTFPTHTSTVSGEQQQQLHESDSEGAEHARSSPVRVGGPTGGRTPRQRTTPRKIKRTAPTPIAVTKPVVKERYTATENRLGGSGREDEELMADSNDEDDDDDDDEDNEDDLHTPS